MKYIKITLFIFLFSFAFGVVNANANSATVIELQKINIPMLSGIWTKDTEVQKYRQSIQEIKKTECYDNYSGDGRVIEAQTYKMYDSGNYSGWIEVPYSYVNWGTNNNQPSWYKIQLKSKKSFLTTATFFGIWSLDN